MSNLLKFNSVVIRDNDKMVIDSNRMVEEIIEQRRKILGQSADGPIADSDGFVCGLEAATVEQLVAEEEPEVVVPEVDYEALRIREEELLQAARDEAVAIKEDARNSGFEEGLVEGREAAMRELEQNRIALEQEYEERKRLLEADYQAMKANMEPELVETLVQVFSKITHTMAESKKDLVVALANSVLKNTEKSKSYLIKVSEEDYGFVASNLDMILHGVAKDVKIDACVDFQLKRNQCIIETDLGVFDCSLDIQLENLINDIRLLSCLESQ